MMRRALTASVNATTRIRRSFASQAASSSSTAGAAKSDPYLTGTSTHFGFEEVAVNEKEGRVRQVFDNVADSYDVMNDLMSAGLHRMWKDHLLHVSSVAALARAVRRTRGGNSELRILDVAGGTGDVAFRFVEAAECLERSKSSGKDPVSVTVCDINTEMLRVGENRARDRYGNQLLDETKALSFVEGNAETLVDFDDNSFDLYTIAFGLRNVTNVDQALSEALRVLKPGGRFMCLEFSQVPNTVLRNIYDTYSFNVIPAMGQMVANDRASYQYLVESIRKFSNQEELVQRMKTAGFQGVKYTNLTGGVVALHEGWKPL
jgi:ubiquinone/menaquinone biosynthesis methyltransferase